MKTSMSFPWKAIEGLVWSKKPVGDNCMKNRRPRQSPPLSLRNCLKPPDQRESCCISMSFSKAASLLRFFVAWRISRLISSMNDQSIWL